MKLTIEKGVPIPAGRKFGCGRTPLYPFKEMEIGDSLFVAGDAGSRMYSAARLHGRRHADWNYAARREGDGWRVWRTA